MEPITFIFSIVVLIISVVIHEVSHGYVAYLQGDPTAKYQGRLTLNPIKHLDLFGSFIVPTISFMLGGFIFGWAKPVPYNPYNVRNQKWGELFIAIAGPASNIAIALIFALVLRLLSETTGLSSAVVQGFALVIFVNIILAVFNMIPIPPLDGSKILSAFLPPDIQQSYRSFEGYGFMFVLVFIFLFSGIIFSISTFLFSVFTGFTL